MGSAASLPDHLVPAWNTAAKVLWMALNEADEAYDLAADVVNALDRAGLIGGQSCDPDCSRSGVDGGQLEGDRG